MQPPRPATAEPALRLLGLAARAGAVLPGTERVVEAARSGKLHFAIVAEDISDNSQDKLVPMLTTRRIPHMVRYRRVDLGTAVGKAPLSAVGITTASFATQLRKIFAAEESAGPAGG